MTVAPAVKMALELIYVPSRVRHARSEPLPEGVLTVLRIAAGEEAVLADAAAGLGRPPELVHAAAAFFIEQILLGAGADSYRILGADVKSPTSELRRNMAFLLRWFHPDVDRGGARSIFAGRVTAAWEDVKTPARRAAYDKRRTTREGKLRSRQAGASLRWPKPNVRIWAERRPGLLYRAMHRLLRGARTERPERS
jgi:hypothetical protein